MLQNLTPDFFRLSLVVTDLMKSKKILVLDSDREFLQNMKELLEGQGHMVVAVTDVLASLDVLIDYTPEIVFLELLLPRIGGDDFCRILRNIDELRNCYIVIISDILAEREADLKALGANACIAKGPFAGMSGHILRVVEASACLPPPGDIPEVLGDGERRVRQATRELLARNKGLKMILESMSQGIVEVYARRVVYANPPALAFLGLSLEKILGAGIAEIFPDSIWQRITFLFEDHRPDENPEDRYVPVRIHERHILVHVLPVKEERNSRIILLSDVTEIRKMESVVEAANLTDKLGYIFSGIRHEIGNPVNSIKVALSVLRKNLDQYDQATVADFLERSLLEVARIEYLLKALKNYSLFESPDIQRLRIDIFMDNFIPLISDEFQRRGVELRVMCADDVGWALADPRALHHVLLNLLTNAADAVEGREDGRVIVSVMKSGPWVEVKVDDNGHGISEADQKNLFRPFFTSKKNGTGLGLVIVQKMLRKMQGRINVTSYKGCGATVTIAIPEAGQDERSTNEDAAGRR